MRPPLPRHSRTRKVILRLCGGAICAAAVLGAAGAQDTVTAVRFWSLGDVTRIAVEGTAPFQFRYDRLENPDRLFFDLIGTKPVLGHKGIVVISVGDRFLRQIRVAETQRAVTRIVLDLNAESEFTTSKLENPDRLIIELHKPGSTHQPLLPETPVQTLKPAPVFRPPSEQVSERKVLPNTPVLEPAPADIARVAPGRNDSLGRLVTAPRYPKPLPPQTQISGASPSVLTPPSPAPSGSVTASAPGTDGVGLPAKRTARDESMIRALGLKVRRIVIDAGHGGHDTGSIGPGGLCEKDLVLDVAQRLGALVSQRLGADVIYTRSDDTFVPLEQRTDIANLKKADLFLSIHANSSSIHSAAGVETYYLNFTTSKAALDVAARENATSQKSVGELQDLLQKIALKDKVDESREFASRIQTSLFAASAHSSARARDRGVRKAPFVVLIGASMPSVLAEIGFISNPHDEALMRRPEYRQKLAEGLYKGLASYASTLSHFQVAQRREE